MHRAFSGGCSVAGMPTAYPAHREADIPLRDGSTLSVRPLRPEDGDELFAFFTGLSETSRAFRFMSGGVDLKRVTEMLSGVDYRGRYGIVAMRGGARRFVGHAGYVRTDPSEAEVAFAVADELQGLGAATVLLAHLAEAATDEGIEVFHAEVLAENRRMLEVFRDSGFPVELRSAAGTVSLTFPTSLSPEAVERFEQRDRVAAVAAVGHVLAPRSVAVIGASRDRDKIGGRLLHNLLSAGFEGPVYPVNPAAAAVQSVRAYPTIAEVPDQVELAVIAVPAELVNATAQECADAGVPALLVVSAGFSELGEAGHARQRELLDICRSAGMRLVGPNCLGVINNSRGVRLNATFAPAAAPAGGVGLMTQSGALGLALIEQSGARELGVSSFASVGNKADISGNDLIRFWDDDEETDVILLYLESFGNARKFAHIAREISRRKPIVAVKSGRSQAGARAARSHTGAMLRSSDLTVDALFRQAGIIRAEGLRELLDVAELLAKQPAPRGSRVAIVTNAGGPGIMCADACEAAGLRVPSLPERAQRELREFLAAEASVANPVDMIATATPEHYRRAIEVVAARGAVDAVIAIFIQPLLIGPRDVAHAIAQGAAQAADVPVIAVLMSEERPRGAAGQVPVLGYAEDAARALAAAVERTRWCERPPPTSPKLDGVRTDEAAAVIAEALGEGASWMDDDRAWRLIRCYGLPVVAPAFAADGEAAGRLAADIGAPVALKAIAPGLVHKTEAGAVRLGLAGAADVNAAAREMAAALDARGHEPSGFIVQRMVEPGPELLVGVTNDELFGPVVACGAGGVEAEVFRDLAVRLVPVDAAGARDLLTSLVTYPRLSGFRGRPPVDEEGLIDVIVRVAQLAESHEEIAELDLNPVIASPTGATIVDARIRLEPGAPARPWPVAD
jgi:acetyl coenzyme A synthetase (ADP forming)-like protein